MLLHYQCKKYYKKCASNNYLMLKIIYCINISFDTGSYDIGIGTKSIIHGTIVFHLHVYLTHIVRTFIDGLNC